MAEFQIIRDVDDADPVVVATCTVADNLMGPVTCVTTGAPGTDETYGNMATVRDLVAQLVGVGAATRTDPADIFDQAAGNPAEDGPEVEAGGGEPVPAPDDDADTAGS